MMIIMKYVLLHCYKKSLNTYIFFPLEFCTLKSREQKNDNVSPNNLLMFLFILLLFLYCFIVYLIDHELLLLFICYYCYLLTFWK